MGLVSLWLGNSHPFRLSIVEYERMCDAVSKLREGAGRHIYFGPRAYERIREDLNDGEIWLLVGGGEWNCDPTRRRFPNIEWVIPDEGAFTWVESIGVTKRGLRKMIESPLTAGDVVGLFEDYLLGADAQRELAESGPCVGAPVNYEGGLLPDFSYLGYDRDALTQLFSEQRLRFRESAPDSPLEGFVVQAEWDRYWASLGI